MKWMLPIVLVMAASSVQAAQLRTTGTSPGFDACVSCIDTCLAGTVAIQNTMTLRRAWTGPASGTDSLAGVLPNTAFSMAVGVPVGTYIVTVVSRQTGEPFWSCPATVTVIVHGKPGKITNLGDAMLFPSRLSGLLASRFGELEDGTGQTASFTASEAEEMASLAFVR